MSDKINWKKAWFQSPGPKNGRDYLFLFLKGVCMGTADIIPGVSGGTIALITGIYSQLLLDIKSFGFIAIKKLIKLELKEALAEVHLRFIFFLLFGISLALLTISRLMNYLLHNYPVWTWSLFVGLILASILILGRKVKHWKGAGGILFLFGLIAGYFLVGLIPVSTPETWWFIIFSGMLAICAMILPGVSGAFILLILGKYEFVTAALKNPFLTENIIIILLFIFGCLIGITGFSRVLSFFISRYENLTLAFLTGLMAGSLRKIWPWKEVLEAKLIRGKLHILQDRNILPETWDSQVFIALFLMLVGFALVLLLERVANKNK